MYEHGHRPWISSREEQREGSLHRSLTYPDGTAGANAEHAAAPAASRRGTRMAKLETISRPEQLNHPYPLPYPFISQG